MDFETQDLNKDKKVVQNTELPHNPESSIQTDQVIEKAQVQLAEERVNQTEIDSAAADAVLKRLQGISEASETESGLVPEGANFDGKNNTLLLKIAKGSLVGGEIAQRAQEKGFDEKEELHITILGFKNGGEIKKILKKMSPEAQQSKMQEIQSLVTSTDWRFVPGKDKYRISKEYKTVDPKTKVEATELRESYIQMVEVTMLQEFYSRLNAILESNLEVPPAHVTLYTKGTDKEKAKMGIGINTHEEFLKMNPELIS